MKKENTKEIGTRKRTKKLKYVLFVSAVLIGGFAIGSTLFSGFVEHTDNIETTYPVTFDGSPCGDLVSSANITGMAGETIEETHTLVYTNQSDGKNFTLRFFFDSSTTVLNDSGINVTLWWDGTDHTNDDLILSAGDTVELTVKYVLHELLIPDTYDVSMSIDILEE